MDSKSIADAENALNIRIEPDKVSNTLKWVLLMTAIVCFIIIIWGTYKTYQLAPPLPNNFQSPIMTISLIKMTLFLEKQDFNAQI